MLIWFVVLYLMVSVGIGLYASKNVHNAKDFAVAGRSLPLPVVTATVFATWFGAEAVFGVSAQFVTEGLGGVVADPFGSSMCLIIAGFFFASKLYKLNILTVGDYYRMRYNRTVEAITSMCIVVSYLGWVAAQIKAMGLIFFMVTNGAVSQEAGMVLGAVIVLTYTTFGGMFSVAILDFVQMAVSMGGLLYIAYIISGLTGGVAPVIEHASAAGKLDFFPPADPWLWITFIGAWLTMMLGSIPQQDVFQRVTSAKDEKTAVRGSLIGGLLYFSFAFVPIFIAYSALVIDPAMAGLFDAEDEREIQRILPHLILERTPLWAQVLFFGALLSAILSTSAGALLAPTALFTENVIRPFAPRLGERQFLLLLRVVLVAFSLAALLFALNSRSTMYEMVQNAYKVTLVSCIVPLAAGIYWKRANVAGAMLSVIFGLFSWGVAELAAPEATIPPQLIGLAFSILGMVLGALVPKDRSALRPRHSESR